MAYSLRTLDQQHTVMLQHAVTTVGSHPGSTLPVHPGFGLAPEQFSIRMAAQGEPWLEDRSGMASTLINGRPVQQQQLVHGDIISAGQLSLIFVGEEQLQQRQSSSTAAVPTPVQRMQTSAVPTPYPHAPAAYTGAVPQPVVQAPAAYTGAVPPPVIHAPAVYTGAVPNPYPPHAPAIYTGAVPPPAVVQPAPVAYTGAVPPPVMQVPAVYMGAIPAPIQQAVPVPPALQQPAVVTDFVPQLDHKVVAAALTPEATQLQSSGQPTSLPPLSEKAVAEAMLSLSATRVPVFFDPAVTSSPLPELPHLPKVGMKELLEQFINAPSTAVPQQAPAEFLLPSESTEEEAFALPALPIHEVAASATVSPPLQIPAISLDGIRTLSNSAPLSAIRSDAVPLTAPLVTGKKKGKTLLLSGGLIGLLSTVTILATKFGYMNLPWLTQFIGGN